MAKVLKVFDAVDGISHALAVEVASLSAQRIAASGRFTVAVSGGSLPAILCKQLSHDKNVDWAKWHLFLADERCVPNTHADSTYALVKKELLDHVRIPQENVHPINDSILVAKDGACSESETAAVAADYIAQLTSVFGDKIEFDLILLGMGPDGHTCSLFPNHPLLKVDNTSVAFLTDSPKPPPARITLTYPVLNAAKNVIFVSTGEGKAQVLHDILIKNKEYPAGLVSPQTPTCWYLDAPAAKLLGSKVSS